MSSPGKRKLNFALAINEALTQMLESDESVMLIGQGVKSPWYVGNTCKNLIERFGEKRVIDTPVSENVTTGAAVGVAIAGMKAIVVHPRVDFAVYAFDPIINQAANWFFMSGGRSTVPVVFWLIVNRGGEQAAQHSQSFHAFFSHVPGLKVVAPATAYDAKGLMIAAINDKNPVVFLDERWLYGVEDNVPEEIYEVPIGKGIVRREGTDVTLISFSWLLHQSLKAAEQLAQQGINAEVIDIRSLKPLDEELIISSVKKTGRVVVVDGTWKFCGYSSEIISLIMENGGIDFLKATPLRVNLPDAPAPASESLEKVYYISTDTIVNSVKSLFSK
ncbi:MAG TPA: pyruvate dehydrogenase complex E1 component subunit beta [Bacteroidia bacterium]|nr:pyruvate dehydrogenase complex E1 component subunit beta [Bacteroidia bacterium]